MPLQEKNSRPDRSEIQVSLNSISWPILLAVIPTLGAFVVGNAEDWGDFILILLILYYVYKWITVPWTYYESARSRRISQANKTELEQELRKHELMGLAWVILSPLMAGYTLYYSRRFLNNHDKYMSSFNITVFVLAASVKPLVHVMALLRERTLFLQNEVSINESELDRLQKKLDIMEEELYDLRRAFATKKDLGQVTNGIAPNIQQLAKAMKRIEKRDLEFRLWSEEKIMAIDKKVQDIDQYICYTLEQRPRRFIMTCMFFPLNLTFWAMKRMTNLLPKTFLLTFSSSDEVNTKSSKKHLRM
ncbi:uncharacterized protein RHIMIDRAFT_263710 [Rhizopus microsporus ATCC 52813]|uniref:Uncharacterized protein n=2 Tax=Rhizopus microsporus TaxID=58291 RepID=A0A2G4SKS3_RHIZD|nr:uncharacterized protein RHIMIDRAFT_263710 [Rhizopus microsporus ATCC 52813]PHZ09371.1 hypothetical protein RHIMIDRAFT_263710 [Rhizopus microsporus ATCC 52813]